jgi:pilus assembly protein CpaF
MLVPNKLNQLGNYSPSGDNITVLHEGATMADASLYMTGPSRTIVSTEIRVNAILGENAKNQLKTEVHHELIKRMDLEKLGAMQTDPGGRQKLLATISQLVGEQSVPLSAADRDGLAKEVLDEVFGLGPLEPLLHDATVSDILVNTYETVYVERRGVIEKTNVVFRDNAHLMHIIDKIVSAVGRRIDESSPMVDARLLDGSILSFLRSLWMVLSCPFDVSVARH